MKQYGRMQEAQRDKESEEESEGFATPPLRPWTEFKTPHTNTGRRRGSNYVMERLKVGNIMPTVIRVQEKVSKSADRMVHVGQLSTELLITIKRSEKARKERKDALNRVVQKYGEIYGHQARRQIAEDEEDERRVVNMREQRIKKREKKEAKAQEKAAQRANSNQ
jgi:hypothetical protein